jgi:hypothetical protein
MWRPASEIGVWGVCVCGEGEGGGVQYCPPPPPPAPAPRAQPFWRLFPNGLCRNAGHWETACCIRVVILMQFVEWRWFCRRGLQKPEPISVTECSLWSVAGVKCR